MPKGQDQWRDKALGVCTCSQLRRVTRAVTARYDGALAPAGITCSQYAVLVNAGRADGVTTTALAGQLGMDRTTLTRVLAPLIAAGWLAAGPGEDRRQRLLRVTAAGRRKLDESFPLWQAAQRELAGGLGRAELAALRNSLEALEAAVRATGDGGRAPRSGG